MIERSVQNRVTEKFETLLALYEEKNPSRKQTEHRKAHLSTFLLQHEESWLYTAQCINFADKSLDFLKDVIVIKYPCIPHEWLVERFSYLGSVNTIKHFASIFIDLLFEKENNKIFAKSRDFYPYLEQLIITNQVKNKDIEYVFVLFVAQVARDVDYNPELFFGSSFVRLCLQRLVIFNSNVEKLIHIYRKKLLAKALESKSVNSFEEECIYTIAVQMHYKEHCMYIDDSERLALDSIGKLVVAAASANNLENISLYICLYAMYEPLFPVLEKATEEYSFRLPKVTQLLLKRCVLENLQVNSVISSIANITEINPGTSCSVKSQYEINPYPRWQSCKYGAYKNFASFISGQQGDSRTPPVFNLAGDKLLVAGCGTGRHSVALAQLLPDANIIGMDLSLKSLAYAKHKTMQMGIKNVEYYQGDILNLSSNNELVSTFDFVDCIGVLHHMSDTRGGLKSLIGVTKVGGFLRIALYSKIARQEIESIRSSVDVSRIGEDTDSIRLFRAKYITSQDADDAVICSRDFYSLSGCRDLLFHEHEDTFTWLEIANLIEGLNVKLVTVSASKEVEQKYRTLYPDDSNLESLDNWHKFELNHTDAFRGMMYFWLQKTSTIS